MTHNYHTVREINKAINNNNTPHAPYAFDSVMGYGFRIVKARGNKDKDFSKSNVQVQSLGSGSWLQLGEHGVYFQ